MNYKKMGLGGLLVVGIVGSGIYLTRNNEPIESFEPVVEGTIDKLVETPDIVDYPKAVSVTGVGPRSFENIYCPVLNSFDKYNMCITDARSLSVDPVGIDFVNSDHKYRTIPKSVKKNKYSHFQKITPMFKRDPDALKMVLKKEEKPIKVYLGKKDRKREQDDPTVTVVHVKSDKTIEYDRYTVSKNKIDCYDPRK